MNLMNKIIQSKVRNKKIIFIAVICILIIGIVGLLILTLLIILLLNQTTKETLQVRFQTMLKKKINRMKKKILKG